MLAIILAQIIKKRISVILTATSVWVLYLVPKLDAFCFFELNLFFFFCWLFLPFLFFLVFVARVYEWLWVDCEVLEYSCRWLWGLLTIFIYL